MSLTERRYRPRFPYHAKAILILLPCIVEATLIDISLTGAHVVLDHGFDIQTGQSCVLRIVNAQGRQVIAVDASVYWKSDEQVGLALTNVTAGMEHALRAMIEMNLGTESLLKRDLSALLRPIRSRDCTAA